MNIRTKAVLTISAMAILCSVAFAFAYAATKKTGAEHGSHPSTVECFDSIAKMEEQKQRLANFLVRHSSVSRMTLSQSGKAPQDTPLISDQTSKLDRHCGQSS